MGFAVNFLSSAADFVRKENYHTDADRVLRLALQYSRRVLLRHDYMPFEFTVFVDKRTDFPRSSRFSRSLDRGAASRPNRTLRRRFDPLLPMLYIWRRP